MYQSLKNAKMISTLRTSLKALVRKVQYQVVMRKKSAPTTSNYGSTLSKHSASYFSSGYWSTSPYLSKPTDPPICSFPSYRKPVTIGARVKHGPDWNHLSYGNQDGGTRNLGSIVSRSIKRGYDFRVKWDGISAQYNYCWGSQGKYELELV